MGGQGGQTGGSLVQYTAPGAAGVMGQIGQQAAYAASQAATEQTNQAITALRQQYAGSLQQLKPYTSQGVTALGEMNQLMGLKAYNPGTAPTAPKLASAKEAISNSDIRQYMLANTEANIAGQGTKNAGLSGVTYSGVGAHNYGQTDWQNSTGGWRGWSDQNRQAAQSGNLIGFYDTQTGGDNSAQSLGKGVNTIMQDQAVMDAVRNYLYEDQRPTLEKQYQAEMDAYNQQNDIYQQAKSIYDQNQTPLTPEEVQAKLAQTPGYQFQLGQGMDALQRAASSKGLVQSGRLLQELVNYGQGLASTTYGDTLNRLSAMVQGGQTAATDGAQLSSQLGSQIAGLRQGLGDTQANSILSGANSQIQALQSQNQLYKVVGQQDTGGSGLGGIGSILGAAAQIGGMFPTGGMPSSEKLKDKVQTPSTEQILNRVKELRLDQWKYKNTSEVHIGPYAEEFKDKFGVGDGQSINMIDAFGVLFASVQALSDKIDRLSEKK
jgi:hypothetical protein